MKLHIHTISSTLYDGPVDSVTLPTEDGEITVLPHHIPLITQLGKGTILVRKEIGSEEFLVSSGFVEISKEGITILAE